MNYLIRPDMRAGVNRCKKTSTAHPQNNHNWKLRKREAGFSLVELLTVVTVISIMTSVTIFSFLGNKRAYQTEDQTLRIMDFMRDAKERALSHRQVMRLEVDLTDKAVRIIDEGTPENASGTDSHGNDKLVRQENLDSSAGPVRIDVQPSNISVLPNINTAATPVLSYPAAIYASSSHPLSAGHNVWAVRFQSNGSVTDSAGGAVPTSATFFVWQPDTVTNYAAPLQAVRAITLFGGTGTIKYWQYDGSRFVGR